MFRSRPNLHPAPVFADLSERARIIPFMGGLVGLGLTSRRRQPTTTLNAA